MTLPTVKMTEGIHVMHLFYRVDRMAWDELSPRESEAARERLEALCAANSDVSRPLLRCFANVSGKADLAFWLFHEDLAQLAQMHRDLEACFPAGSIDLVYSKTTSKRARSGSSSSKKAHRSLMPNWKN